MSGFLPPVELFKSLLEIGEKKAGGKAMNLFILGILAGAYIGFAAHLATTIATGSFEWYGAKKFLTGAVFSFGLMLVIIPGSELWTGNNLMVVSLLEKRITFADMMRNWLIVYAGNFVGSVMLAFFIAKSSGLLDGAVGATAIKIAATKLTASPEGLDHNYAYFFRAMGCNWLVCLAVMMALAAKDIAGKIIGIFFPIMAFVASGFEHSIANMYFIPAGIFAKSFSSAVSLSGVSPEYLAILNWSDMWMNNIITVTMGNFVGGTLFVGVVYWWLYIRK
jgi:formate/nitrite transporter